MKRWISSFVRQRRRAVGLVTCLISTAVLGCGACGPAVDDGSPPELPSKEGQQYASALCEAMEACGCAQPFDSQEACEAEHHARFDKLLEAGFEVAPECFESWLDHMRDDPCREQSDPSGSAFPCAPLRGSKNMGADCGAHLELLVGVDECSEGSTCLDGLCAETPPTNQVPWKELAEGEPCGPTYVGFCRMGDLYCDPVDRVCRERVPLGSECFAGGCEQCSEEGAQALYCAGATTTTPGTCEALPSIGESCDPQRLTWCGGCGRPGWCEPTSSACVEGRAPLLCTQVFLL